MFGFLKKLGKKSEPEPPVAAPVQRAAPPSSVPGAPLAPASSTAASKVVMPGTSSKREPELSKQAPSQPAAAAQAPVDLSGPTVDLPLKPIWSKLDLAVVQLASGKPGSDAALRLPLGYIQPMLARGAVKIPFTLFRQFAPADLFPASSPNNNLEVVVPLSDLLSVLKPDQLPRRTQKKVEVPDDIGPVFGPGAASAGLRVADAKSKVAAPAPEATPAPAAPLAPAAPPPPIPPPPKPIPAAAAPAPTISPIAPAPEVAPVIPPPPVLNTTPIQAPKLDPSLATLKPKLPVSEATSTAGSGTFNIAMMDLAEHWAKSGKKELENLYKNTLEIPVAILERALKTGKLVFPWREVRPWVKVTPGNTLPAIPDDFQVDLPLAVVAPRFLQLHGTGKPRKRVEVSQEIPDLFAQKQAAPPASAPVPSAPAPAAAVAPSMPVPAVPSAGPARPALEFGEIFGQPDKKNWTLAEVTQKTAAMRGVAGALVGTADGLLVAGSWPPGVKTESVAAFIPQMYSRMVQCTKELKLGEPGNLTLTIENVPLQIFKTGGNYFVVLGRAGENLPKAQLTALAVRLAMTQPAK